MFVFLATVYYWICSSSLQTKNPVPGLQVQGVGRRVPSDPDELLCLFLQNFPYIGELIVQEIEIHFAGGIETGGFQGEISFVTCFSEVREESCEVDVTFSYGENL